MIRFALAARHARALPSLGALLVLLVPAAAAAPTLVQTNAVASAGAVGVISASYTAQPTAGNLLVAAAFWRDAVTSVPIPSGWNNIQAAPNFAPGGMMIWKIAGAAEPSTVTVDPTGSSQMGLQIYEHSGISNAIYREFQGSAGSDATLESTPLTTTSPDELIVVGFIINTATSFSSWTNSFNERNDLANTGGSPSTYGGADLVAPTAGSYTTTAQAGAAASWYGQAARFSSAGAPCPGWAVTTSADSGVGSLRECIKEANGVPGAQTITVPAGTYTLTIAGTGENAAATGDLDITSTVTIAGVGSASTVIQAGTTSANGIDRVFEVFSGVTATISGVTIRYGRPGAASGGGIRNRGTLNLTDVIVTGNTITGGLGGGGISSEGVASAMTLAGVTVSGNTATGKDGGGIFNEGSATLTDATISGNTCGDTGGGVKNNTATSSFTLTRGTISGNTATDSGGGIESDGTLNLTNVTISGNTTTAGPGGGLTGETGSATILNCTFSGDSATTGGEIRRTSATVTLKNTIVANSVAGGNCSGTIVSQGYNLDSANTCAFTGPGDRIATNPNLGPLASNGGPTQTHALLSGSPAIDAGTATGAPGTDQRGVGRPQGAAYDIGAYEVVSYSITGKVFEDANFAGTALGWDGGVADLGLANVDVELYDAGTNAYIASTTTAAGGTFTFGNVANGNYKVRVRSATIGDADTPPKGGLNATVPATWPYPLAELTWGNGVALYGGQSAAVDDTATGDNAGPGDTFVTVTVSGANVTGVDFGLAYNLIVNASDDSSADNVRSRQGSLRQFLKNANAIGTVGGTTANSSQFRMQVAANQSSGGDSWWRISPAAALPSIADSGTTLDGSTQRANSGADSNSLGPEIELYGGGLGFSGLSLTSSGGAVRELILGGFSANARAGVLVTGASATGNTIAGNYVGTNYAGTAASANYHGVLIDGGAANNLVGGTTAAARNVISGNTLNGVRLAGAGTASNQVHGNTIGLDAAGSSVVGNGGAGVYLDLQVGAHTIGGTAAGSRNVISGNGLGVHVDGANNITIQGNWIGLDAGGNLDRGNNGPGVQSRSVNLTIGGTAAGVRNVISGNNSYGIYLDSTTGAVIQGNYIGTNATGAAAVGNGDMGILAVGDNTTVGGNTASARNVISGNGHDGIQVHEGSTGVTIQGNYVGVGSDGTSPIGNGWAGLRILGSGKQVGGTGAGEGNVIAHNNGEGVAILGAGAINNPVLGNSIFANAGLGIDLGGDGVTLNNGTKNGGLPNSDMDFPVFTRATLTGSTLSFAGYVGSAAHQATFAGARVEIFESDNDPSGHGEGPIYLGAVTADASGDFAGSLTVAGLAVGDTITATATDASNNTSEFGSDAPVQPLSIVKRAFRTDGTPLPSGTVTPKGALVKFLLYVNNPGAALSDASLEDALDPSLAYVAGSLRYSGATAACAALSCTGGEEDAIFAAADGGTAGSDALDGDVVGFSGTKVYAGDQNAANARLDIAAGKVWALVFTVRIR